MGELLTNFMPKRWAQLYVEKLRLEGEEKAKNWWKYNSWRPSEEDYLVFNKEVNKLLNPSGK